MPLKLIKNDEEFKNTLDGTKLIVAFFSVPWCIPCRVITPLFQKLSKIYTNAEFIKINCMNCPEVAVSNEVVAFPTFIFYLNKARIDSLLGVDPCLLLDKIEAHYGTAALNLVEINPENQANETVDNSEGEFESFVEDLLGDNAHFLGKFKEYCAKDKLEGKKKLIRLSEQAGTSKESPKVVPVIRDPNKFNKESKANEQDVKTKVQETNRPGILKSANKSLNQLPTSNVDQHKRDEVVFSGIENKEQNEKHLKNTNDIEMKLQETEIIKPEISKSVTDVNQLATGNVNHQNKPEEVKGIEKKEQTEPKFKNIKNSRGLENKAVQEKPHATEKKNPKHDSSK